MTIDSAADEDEEIKSGGSAKQPLFESEHDKEKDDAIISLALALNVSLDDYPTLALKWFSWITTLRLFSIRACREEYVWEGIYSFNWYGYSTILQFSYILEFIPCFMQLYKNYDLRVDNEWQSNFTNAFVWSVVNGISYTTGFAALNLIGFAFDIWHDYYYTDQEIKAERKKLRFCARNTHKKNSIEEKIKELEYKKIRVTCVGVALFIGMGLFYLNPISSGAAIAGACLVFIFGGVIGNLGNRLFQWDKRLLIGFSNEDNFLQENLREKLSLMSCFQKLFKEFIKPLSPTLFNSLEDFTKDSVNALSCIMFASVPAIAFAYAWSHYFNMSFFVIAPVHMLLITAGILIATELCVRLGNHFTYQTRVENITKKLETISNAKQYNDNAHGFSCFSPQEIEILANLAELSVKKLLSDIHNMHHQDKYLVQSTGQLNDARATSSPTFSTYSSSLFYSFKQKINLEAKVLKNTEKPNPLVHAS